MIRCLVVLTVLLSWGNSSPVQREDAPSCQACHSVDPFKINVHLIPHSHDDVGWLKTLDQYYYGSHNEIQRAGVQYIISSTVEALKADPTRRFVQVETAFFWKWWQNQPDSIRQDFTDLVNNGQIEIINAAWSMNDEAATNYQSTIDQFTYGLRTINDTLGRCATPKIGWQIDPFGHSREQASIFAQLGFDGVFFARIDDDDRTQRTKKKNMEVIWRGSANVEGVDIFTNIFPEFYTNPSGYCFDIECGDEVLNDDDESPDYNIPKRVKDFEDRIKHLISYYQTNNLLIPMGGDFQYQAAEKNFINMDKLIAGFKNNSDINLIYSTPSCYIKAVNEEAAYKSIKFNLKTDDFFPYGSDSHCYWTGYFTSRPNAKRFERLSNNILQAAKQLTSFSKFSGEDHEEDLTLLKQAMGTLQHHDAITGTAKQAVAKDYSRLLNRGIKKVEPVLGSIITKLLKKEGADDITLDLQTCLLANVSVCDATSSGRFLVTVYNPLERPVTHYVRLPVDDDTYTVTGPDGEVKANIFDSISTFDYLSKYATPKPKELVFAAEDVPGFGLRLYYVEKNPSTSKEVKAAPTSKYGTDTTNFEIDEETGLLKSVTMNGQTVAIKQEFLFYQGFNGNNSLDYLRASGAYIFRPLENEAISVSDSVFLMSTTSSLVDEVYQQFNDWITQIIRVYKGQNDNYIEFDWLVGPVQVDNDTGIGTEVISRFTIEDFDNSETFYTDSNGRELIKRQLNKRYDYEYDASNEPIASNYYPVTSKILIRDETKNLEVAVLNDRAQGGSSLTNGALELMVHRRLLMDDDKGVGEALNDTEFNQGVVARGQHYLVLGSINAEDENAKTTATQERELALEKLLTPLILVADASSDDLTLDKVQSSLNFNFEGLKKTLPENVHVLSFEPWKEDTYLLRLEHILEKNEDPNLSQSVTVDLSDMFSLFKITEIRETTLGANQWLDEFENKAKYTWISSDGDKIVRKNSEGKLKEGSFQITLDPMQIRTFIIKVA